ncbi:MAG: PDZ domain-containing protein [Anaerolineae bacterium]|nr:PDZ domain-containing protein [Anaerolineae bacterium]
MTRNIGLGMLGAGAIIAILMLRVAAVQAQGDPTATLAITFSATPTIAATVTTTMTATATFTAIPCPKLPPLEATTEATADSTAEPTLTSFDPGYLGIAAENSMDGCGAVVVDLDPQGPAKAAGVQIGDVIYGAASLETRTVETLKRLIGSFRPGVEVTLYISRRGELLTLQVILADFNASVTPTVDPSAAVTRTLTPTMEATSEPTSEATAFAAATASSTP